MASRHIFYQQEDDVIFQVLEVNKSIYERKLKRITEKRTEVIKSGASYMKRSYLKYSCRAYGIEKIRRKSNDGVTLPNCMCPLCRAFRYSAIGFCKKRRKFFLMRALEYLQQLHLLHLYHYQQTHLLCNILISPYTLLKTLHT